MSTIGERIQRARLARKMSGEELALAVGYRQQSAIGNLENRGGGTGGKKLPEIARALRVPMTWLIEGPDDGEIPFLDSPPYPTSTAEPVVAQEPSPATYYSDASMQEAIDLFRRLKTEQRLKAMEYIRELLSGTEASTNQSGRGESDPVPRSKTA